MILRIITLILLMLKTMKSTCVGRFVRVLMCVFKKEENTMKKMIMILVALLSSGIVNANTVDFGAFSLDFTDTLSGASNPASGYGVVNYDYQMGVHEITQSQFDAFRSDAGFAANTYTYTNGVNRPANQTSWFEAAQFVNWLNTSQGHQAAYDITSVSLDVYGHTFNAWGAADAANGGTNLYRHKDAVFFMPSEDEWVKAAYWNGTNLQTYATVGDTVPTQAQSNYYDGGYAVGSPDNLWDAGSGVAELNGTHDMLGNVWEWMESPYSPTYGDHALRSYRGGAFYSNSYYLGSLTRIDYTSWFENSSIGFRVASVPEPCTISLLAIGGVSAIRRRRKL